MHGQSLTHIGGGDRTVPFHVSYSEPAKRPTGLNWDALRSEPTTAAEVVAALPRCINCRQRVDSINTNGHCTTCEHDLDPHNNQPPPATPKEITMATPPAAPAYITELTELLTATEGHPDPVVRAVRKIVTQSAIALQQALAAAPKASSPGAPPRVLPTPVPASAPALEPTYRPSVQTRLLDLGITMAEVREWASKNGVECNSRGTVRVDVLDAYEAAHATAA